MKIKNIAALTAICVVASIASSKAEINITWRADGGFYSPADGVTPLLDPAVKSALVQLISAGANGVIDPVDPNAVNFIGGDDVLLDQIVFVNNSNDGFSEYAAAQFGIYVASFSSFSFYGRIFQDATPTAAEKYFNGVLAATSDLNVPPNSGQTQIYDFNNGNLSGDQLDQTIVPEPSVFAFLGLGGMLIAIRRRMARA